MMDATWIAHTGAALAAVAGFAWLALAMDVHWQQVQGGSGPGAGGTRMVLRVLGIAGLMASPALCFLVDRPSVACWSGSCCWRPAHCWSPCELVPEKWTPRSLVV